LRLTEFAGRQIHIHPHLLQLLGLGHAYQTVQCMQEKMPAAAIVASGVN
jgi:hypothetical protein